MKTINLKSKNRISNAIDKLPTSPEKQSALVLKLKNRNTITDIKAKIIKSESTNNIDWLMKKKVDNKTRLYEAVIPLMPSIKL